MNYIYFEEGNDKSDIKVISEKGEVKYFPKRIAENEKLMRDSGYTIVQAPFKMEPAIKETELEETNVAETAEAKRPGKIKTK